MINFAQTRSRGGDRFDVATLAGYIVKIPKTGKHREYARYAEHCLHMVTATEDQGDRDIQREMAVEWIRLAELVLAK